MLKYIVNCDVRRSVVEVRRKEDGLLGLTAWRNEKAGIRIQTEMRSLLSSSSFSSNDTSTTFVRVGD